MKPRWRYNSSWHRFFMDFHPFWRQVGPKLHQKTTKKRSKKASKKWWQTRGIWRRLGGILEPSWPIWVGWIHGIGTGPEWRRTPCPHPNLHFVSKIKTTNHKPRYCTGPRAHDWEPPTHAVAQKRGGGFSFVSFVSFLLFFCCCSFVLSCFDRLER